ncbi:hypothetical protein [Microbacterium mangrovi]|uniref:hypothetical protein n=1 Tax=Microbacterium mangrovi TaxID=1348253 RepID=UPI000AC40C6C|nr:hypothetical protein [Microbacterium mangrovi]
MTALQKLLFPATTAAYLRQGSSLLAGPVVRIADAIGWRTPVEVLSAYGLDAAGVESVDVLRFENTPLTRLSVPQAGDATSVAGYDLGFLRGPGAGVVPVWDVAPTTVPRDSELWRIHADGKQELISAYAGPAFGWRGTGVFVPPTMIPGPRAQWHGAEYAASWTDPGHLEIVTLAETAPDGFEQTRPNVFRRVVEAAECSRIFEVSFTSVWRGAIRCTMLQSNQEQAAVLLHCDAQTAADAGAVALEPGVFWHLVPQAELTEVSGTTSELPVA